MPSKRIPADGQTLPLRLWWPGGGACHTLLAGTTGSGKSAALDLILCEVAASDQAPLAERVKHELPLPKRRT